MTNITVDGGTGQDFDSSKAIYYGDFPAIETYIYGYALPPLALVTVMANGLVCSVLLRPSMRSPTNIILTALAISDTICAVLPIPLFVYLYTFGNIKDYVPIAWCYPDKSLIVTASIFHTISIWLTIFLSIHRYIKICAKPYSARLCSRRQTLIVIVCLYMAAIGLQAVRLFENEYHPVTLLSKSRPGQNVTGCIETEAWFVKKASFYRGLNMAFRVIFVKFLPCILLAVFNALLIRSLQQASKQRQKMFANKAANTGGDWKYVKTTRVLVVITSLTLLVELVTSTDMMARLIKTAGGGSYDKETTVYLNCFIHLLIVLGYPINFVVYCTMAKKFRDVIRKMFVVKPKHPHIARSSS